MKTNTDINIQNLPLDNIYLVKTKSGLQLITDNKISGNNLHLLTLQSLNKVPYLIYILSLESGAVFSNNSHLKTFSYEKTEDSLGKTVFDMIPKNKKKYAEQIRKNDLCVLSEEKAISFYEVIPYITGEEFITLSLKMPIYSSKQELIGIFGCSILVNKQSSNTVEEMIFKFFKNEDFKAYPIWNKKSLTKRERECMFWYTKGMRSKEIAKQLAISVRTVENHIANIKSKLSCSSRFELTKKRCCFLT